MTNPTPEAPLGSAGNSVGGVRVLPTTAQLAEWRKLARETMMISAVGEYTPEEFTTLLDAVETLKNDNESLRAAAEKALAAWDKNLSPWDKDWDPAVFTDAMSALRAQLNQMK